MRLFGYDVEDNSAPVYDASKKNQEGFDANGWKAGDGWWKEMNAILPYWISETNSKALQDVEPKKNLQLVSFNNDWNTVLSAPFVRTIGKVKAGLQEVQISDEILLASDYEDEYITKEVPATSGNYVTYAIRFKGTKYESAWRYEITAQSASSLLMVILGGGIIKAAYLLHLRLCPLWEPTATIGLLRSTAGMARAAVTSTILLRALAIATVLTASPCVLSLRIKRADVMC